MSEPASDGQAAGYGELADRVENAEQSEVWDAFAHRMETLASDGSDDHEWAGFVFSVSECRIGEDAPLEQVIGVAYRQYGDSADGLHSNAVARESDVYATRRTSVQNPVEVCRKAVVDALEAAAASD